MVPQSSAYLDILEGFTVEELPSKTFYIDTTRERITGKTDGLTAVRQAIFLILSTERYAYFIHSWDYGVELDALYGKPDYIIYPELTRRITEALTADNRILDAEDFVFSKERGSVHVTFTAKTIYGDVEGALDV